MRKKQPQKWVSSNAATARNANFQVTLDFTGGPRGTVEIKARPPTAEYPKSTPTTRRVR